MNSLKYRISRNSSYDSQVDQEQLLPKQKQQNFLIEFMVTQCRTLKEKCQFHKGLFKSSSQYIWADSKKRPKSLVIWLISIIFVIVFVGILDCAVEFSQLVFLRISEQIAGESDIQITAQPSQFLNRDPSFQEQHFVNYTEINEQYCNKLQNYIEGCTPRWFVPIRLLSNPKNRLSNTPEYTGSYLVIVDEEKEKELGLGKHLNLNNLKEGQGILSNNVRQYLNMDSQNDNARFQIDIQRLLLSQMKFQDSQNKTQSLLNQTQDLIYDNAKEIFNQNNQQVWQDLGSVRKGLQSMGIKKAEDLKEISQNIAEYMISMPHVFKIPITQYVDNFDGKLPSTVGNVLMIDSSSVNYLIQQNFKSIISDIIDRAFPQNNSIMNILISNQIVSEIKKQQKIELKVQDLNQYAFQVEATVKDKSHVYNYRTHRYKVFFSNKFFEIMGQNYNSKLKFNLMTYMNDILKHKPFLNNLFDSSILLLLIICCYLIYAMSMTDIENKVTEMSIFRTLGFPKFNVMFLLLLKGLYYSIPAFIVGLFISFILKVALSNVFEQNFSYTYSYNLQNTFIYKSIQLGILMPVISSILPARRALSQSLSDSLNPNKRFQLNIKVMVNKLEKMGITPYQFLNSILLIGIGQLCYTLIPDAYITNQESKFLTYINYIFLIFILGLVLFSQMIITYLQKGLVNFYCCIFKKYLKIKPLIFNNFESHKRKTSKISLIYSLAFTFIIFISMGINLQEKLVTDAMTKNIGADLTAEIKGFVSIEEEGVQEIINQHKQKYPDRIDDISFISNSITSIPGIKKVKISNFNTKKNHSTTLKTVKPNFLDTVKSQFYQPGKIDPKISQHKIKSSNKINGLDSIYIYNENSFDKYDSNYQEPQSRGQYIENNTYKSNDVKNILSQNQYIEKLNDDDDKNIIDIIIDMKVIDPIQKNKEQDLLQMQQKKAKQLIKQKYTKEMFSEEQVILCAVSTNTLEVLSLDIGDNFILEITPEGLKQKFPIRFRAQVLHSIDYLPAEQTFSPNTQLQTRPEILISQQQLAHIRDVVWGQILDLEFVKIQKFLDKMPSTSQDMIPIQKMFIKFKKPLNYIERQEISDQIKFSLEHEVLIYDLQTNIEGVQNGMYALKVFLSIIGIIMMILGFFLILILFNSAVNEKITELKIMRAIGLNNKQISKIYQIESISIVLASGIVGLTIGFIISVTLTYEVSLLIQIPVTTFNFNFTNTIILFIAGILSAYIASNLAISPIRKKQIADIDRNKQ